MGSERRHWHTLIVILCFLLSTVVGLALSLTRLGQEVDFTFERVRSDPFQRELISIEDVRCPVALAEGETGTISLRLTGREPGLYAVDLGPCRQIVEAGDPLTLTCQIRPEAATPDHLIVTITARPFDSGVPNTSAPYDREPVCGIPVTHLGDLSGQQALMLTYAPIPFGIALGTLFWLRRGRPHHAQEWAAGIVGGLLAGIMLVSAALIVFTTEEPLNQRGYNGLFIAAILLLTLLILATFAILLGGRHTAPAPPAEPPVIHDQMLL
jgi:hypothetical protein